YVVTRDELRGQIDASLHQKITPGTPQAVQFQAKIPSAIATRETQRLARALAGVGPSSVTTHASAKSRAAGVVVFRSLAVGQGGKVPPPLGLPAEAQGGLSARAQAAPGRGAAAALLSGSSSAELVNVVLPAAKLGGASGYAQLLRPDGNVLRSQGPGAGLPVNAATRAVAAGRRAAFYSDTTVDGTHVRVLTERAPLGEGVWQIALPLSSVDSTLANLRWLLAAVSVGGILLAAALGLLVSRAALVPVRRLTGAAEQVARTQDLGHRIPPGGEGDELGRLAGSFNTMLAALESSRLAQRQLVSDASHELRTPLTSVRANLDALAAGASLSETDRARAIGAARSQLAELTVLVGDLVDLSKTGVESVELEDVRLDLAVAAAVARARERAPGCRYVVHAEACLVRAAPARLDRAITNLLENACKWGSTDGPVEVEVRAGTLRVRDHGAGIAPEDLPRVFDRFYRAPGARGMPGSGLGLAIVRHFAETHGGSVHAASDAGCGATLTLELPSLAMTAADAGA
ncbi:MAG TPA: HAMP domain-containing sensor histidine kinase, partial [Solirubrobacteraceae bacterium]|nr:HAMP domain-containing sensor histidine kinase [Solirubrobacteraceae bacterium]